MLKANCGSLWFSDEFHALMAVWVFSFGGNWVVGNPALLMKSVYRVKLFLMGATASPISTCSETPEALGKQGGLLGQRPLLQTKLPRCHAQEHGWCGWADGQKAMGRRVVLGAGQCPQEGPGKGGPRGLSVLLFLFFESVSPQFFFLLIFPSL